MGHFATTSRYKCMPAQTAELRGRIISRQAELRDNFLEHEDHFLYQVRGRDGLFMGNFLMRDARELLLREPIVFRTTLASFDLYRGAIYNENKTRYGVNTHLTAAQELLYGAFGEMFRRQVGHYIDHMSRVEAWERYWSKEFGESTLTVASPDLRGI